MRKFIIISAVVLSSFLANFSASAKPLSSVEDMRGKPVYDSNNNCVRHDWMRDSDVCAPASPMLPPPPVTQEESTPEVIIPSAKELKVEDRTVYFEFDKSNLTDTAKTKLDSLAEVLKADAEVKSASIIGYADHMGKDDYNLKLSQQRAVAVQNYLAEKGYIKTELANTRWVGEAESKTDCSKSKKRKAKIECLALDRKVEVEINFLQ